MALATQDLNAPCACGRTLGDHGALDPHPCAASNCHGFRAPGTIIDGQLRLAAMVDAAGEIDLMPVPAPIIDAPIAPAPVAKPSALDGATHGVVVVPDADAAGAMVWWRLSGSIDVDKLAAAWAARGLPEDEMLAHPTPAYALQTAVFKLRSRHVLTRPLPGSEGWAVVVEQTDAAANDLTFSTGMKVTRTDDVLTFDPPDHPARQQVEASYAAALSLQSAQQVGLWLSKLARRACDAIGLRESGGVYFVPAPKVAAWKERIATVREVSGHTFALVPAMRTEDAVAAVVDALTLEAGAEAAALEEEVMDGKLTARSLETRADRTKALAEKVGRYAQLMGAAMPAVSERLEQLQATIAAATLAARAAEEAK